MSARVLDGRAVAASLKEELRTEVAAASGVGALAIVRGGGDEASEVYARRLEALCSELGVEVVPVGEASGDRIEISAAEADVSLPLAAAEQAWRSLGPA